MSADDIKELKRVAAEYGRDSQEYADAVAIARQPTPALPETDEEHLS